MENILSKIITYAFIILKLFCLYRIYVDTIVDPFKDYFLKDEKEKFFTKNYNNEKELELDCSFFEHMIMEPDTIKLGNIFNLNYFTINSSSFFLIISDIILYCLILLLLLLGMLSKFSVFFSRLFLVYIQLCGWFLFAYGVQALIFNYYLLSSYFNSNTAFFLDFLKCPNVNLDGFKKYYESALIFESDIRHYIILFFIQIIYQTCLKGLVERI